MDENTGEKTEYRDTTGLLSELKKLAAAGKAGNFNINLNYGGLSREDAEIIRILNETVDSYRNAMEYDLMKYKLTSDALDIALWDMDVVSLDPLAPNNKFTWSQEFRHKLGFQDEHDFPDVLQSWSNRLHPEDKEMTLNALVAHLNDRSGGTPYDVEYRLMMKNGDYRNFQAFGTTQRDNTGTPLRVAGALMDITEKKQMAEASNQSERLMSMGNCAAKILLEKESEENIEAALMEIMELIGRSADIHCTHIWRNEMIDGELCFVHTYQWHSDAGRVNIPARLKIPCKNMPEWESVFLRGECINAPLSEMNENEQKFLNTFGMKAVAVIPLFLHEKFWGLFSIDDYKRERKFTEDEINILRSISLIVASAINRSEQVAEIRDAHVRAKLMLDATPLACRLWDKDFKVFELNEETVKLFKAKDKREVIDDYFAFSPEYQPDGQNSREKGLATLQKTFEEGRHILEWTHKASDGALIPTEITLVRVKFGNEDVIAGYTRDLRVHKKMIAEIKKQNEIIITEKKKTEELAHWYKSILDATPFPISVTDRDMNWTFVNKAVEDFLGTRLENIRGKPCSNWKTHICDTPDCGIACAKRGLKRAYFNQKGRYHQVDVEILTDIAGEVSGFIEVVQDITELQAAAEKIEAALDEAQKANSAKTTFLANMSHEMRTPLNAVIGLSALSLEAGRLHDEDRAHIETIYNAGLTLLSTVNDILDISKIEAGKLELVPVEYEVPSLINDAVTQNIMRIGDKPIKLILDINSDLFAHLYGDELRVKQIINNLLSNAIKYTREGTVKLIIRNERENDSIWLTVQVRDSGMGIRPEDMEKLFAEYTQIDMESNRKIEGTGLGLPLTKNLVALMDGTINAESEYGEGSTFTIKVRQRFVTDVRIGGQVVESLKNFRYSNNKHNRDTQIKRVHLPYARVLVVDDNLTNLAVAKGLMKPYGMKIDCADRGQKAVDAVIAGEVRYNAIFMDHMMPGMDGIETAQAIRNIGTDYALNVPIIALTANAIVGNEEIFLNSGFQAFLTKPINIPRLDEVIKHWVRDKELEKTLTEQQLTPDSFSAGAGKLEGRQIAGLDIGKGIERFGGDEEIYLDVLRSFAANTRNLLESMENVGKGTLAEYAIAVHGIKGSSWGIFADAVGNAAEGLENASKAGDFEYVSAHNRKFIDDARDLIRELEDMIAVISGDDQKQIKDKPAAETLSNLLAACEAFAMEGVYEAMKELENFEYKSGNELVLWLRENVDMMNYMEIAERLSEYR